MSGSSGKANSKASEVCRFLTHSAVGQYCTLGGVYRRAEIEHVNSVLFARKQQTEEQLPDGESE